MTFVSIQSMALYDLGVSVWMVMIPGLCVTFVFYPAPAPQSRSLLISYSPAQCVHSLATGPSWFSGTLRRFLGLFLCLHIYLLPLSSENSGCVFELHLCPYACALVRRIHLSIKPQFLQGSQYCGICCPVTKNSCFLHFF